MGKPTGEVKFWRPLIYLSDEDHAAQNEWGWVKVENGKFAGKNVMIYSEYSGSCNKDGLHNLCAPLSTCLLSEDCAGYCGVQFLDLWLDMFDRMVEPEEKTQGFTLSF